MIRVDGVFLNTDGNNRNNNKKSDNDQEFENCLEEEISKNNDSVSLNMKIKILCDEIEERIKKLYIDNYVQTRNDYLYTLKRIDEYSDMYMTIKRSYNNENKINRLNIINNRLIMIEEEINSKSL